MTSHSHSRSIILRPLNAVEGHPILATIESAICYRVSDQYATLTLALYMPISHRY